jgi:hypothetical protein
LSRASSSSKIRELLKKYPAHKIAEAKPIGLQKRHASEDPQLEARKFAKVKIEQLQVKQEPVEVEQELEVDVEEELEVDVNVEELQVKQEPVVEEELEVDVDVEELEVDQEPDVDVDAHVADISVPKAPHGCNRRWSEESRRQSMFETAQKILPVVKAPDGEGDFYLNYGSFMTYKGLARGPIIICLLSKKNVHSFLSKTGMPVSMIIVCCSEFMFNEHKLLQPIMIAYSQEGFHEVHRLSLHSYAHHSGGQVCRSFKVCC